MNLNDILVPVEDLLTWTFQIFEVIGNSFNYAVIILGFVGLFIWLRMQMKYNKEAEGNPSQIK